MLKKRAALIITITVFLFSLTAIRTAMLSTDKNAAVSRQNSTKSIILAQIRGNFFDRGGQPLTNCEKTGFAAITTPEGAASAAKYVDEKTALYLARQTKLGLPVTAKINEYYFSAPGAVSAAVSRRYESNQLAAHILGYVTPEGKGVCSLEKCFDGFLSESAFNVEAVFGCDAEGRVLQGEQPFFRNADKEQKSGVVLTIDKRIQQITESALDSAGIKRGAAVVINIKTGEITACASRPVFDSSSPVEALKNEDSPFLNRAFCGYALGSAFKPVVAAAALENGIGSELEFECTGSTTINGVTFHCHNREGHGKINMSEAITCSCNIYFIKLSQLITRQNILNSASAFGYGSAVEFCRGLSSSGGNLPSLNELDSKAAVANLAFGQGTLLASPLQVTAMMACIANGGIYNAPSLILGTKDENGVFKQYENAPESRRAITEKTALKLQKFLKLVMTDGTGTRGQPLFGAAGKTATAQTGRRDENGDICHAWFAGYFPADSPQYAVCVFEEEGGEGAISCAPVFKKIAEKTVIY